MRQRLLARATSLKAMAVGLLSAPTSPREYEEYAEAINAKSEEEAAGNNCKKHQSRRKSLFDWGSKANTSNNEVQGFEERLKSLQEYVRKKEKRPHYSQIHGGKIEVMTADDDPINQLVFEGLLSPLGYVVTPAMDGEQAMHVVRSRDYLPDVILLDVQMPGKTGYEVCEDLRKEFPDGLPIIMISANTDEASILKGLEVGANDYVKKPFSRAELIARVETQIRLRDGWMAEVEAVRSNDLLGQVFPEHVTDQLLDGAKMVAESHECVTILFSDIVGFTSLSAEVGTAELFEMLNRMYTMFDALADKHGVYKVDTIGDAYMVAAGHEDRSKMDHHLRMLAMAKDMIIATRMMVAPNGSNMRIRIGMHTGPAIAGVVGVKCPKYTFIGDTVNTASRMESNGFPMCIHVSKPTMELLSPYEEWLEYGNKEIKGKGIMTTYLAKQGDWESAIEKLKDESESRAAAALSGSRQAPVEDVPSLQSELGSNRQQVGKVSAATQTSLCNEEEYHSNPPQAPENSSDYSAPDLRSQMHSDVQLSSAIRSCSIAVQSNLELSASQRKVAPALQMLIQDLKAVKDSVSELTDDLASIFVESTTRAVSAQAELQSRLLHAEARSSRFVQLLKGDINRLISRLSILSSELLAARTSILDEVILYTNMQAEIVQLRQDCAKWRSKAMSLPPADFASFRVSETERAHTERNFVCTNCKKQEFEIEKMRKEVECMRIRNDDIQRMLNEATRAANADRILIDTLRRSTFPSDSPIRAHGNGKASAQSLYCHNEGSREIRRFCFDDLAFCALKWSGCEGEVNDLLRFFDLEHYGADLCREEIKTIHSLSQLSELELEQTGVRSHGARRLLIDSCRGLCAIIDRARNINRGTEHQPI